MSPTSPTEMSATPPDPDVWSKGWFAAGAFIGGLFSAIAAKMHWSVRGPTRARFEAVMDRIDQLEVNYEEDRRKNDRRFSDVMHELRAIRARME